MTRLAADLRYAVRTLRRSPGFTLVAVLTLAIGIGATTTIFSVLNAVVLQPLAYPDADRLVWVSETTPDGSDFSASEPNYLDFRDRARSFAHLAAATDRQVTLLGGAEPERLNGAGVTANYFAVLGVAPTLGRAFLPEEAVAGAPIVVLSDRLSGC